MAEFHHLIDPDFLTSFLRERLRQAAEDRESNQFILNRWFPNEPTDSIEVEWDAGPTRTYETAIPMRTWTTESDIGRRDGKVRKSGEIAPFSRKLPLTERDIIKLREAQRQGGEAETFAQEVFLRDIDKLVKGMLSAMESHIASAIDTGQNNIDENGVQLDVDWARDASHSDTVSTGWSVSATATPYDDEEAVLDVLEDDADLIWSDLVAVMNTTTYRNWKNTSAVLASFNSVRELDRLPDSELVQLRADHGLPPIIRYDARRRDVSGTVSKLVPDGKVWYLPAVSAVGSTKWARPAMADDPDLSLDLDLEPGPIAYMTKTIDPVYALWTEGQAVAFPIFADTDATFSLDVEP